MKWQVRLGLSSLLCLGALFPYPSPVRNVVTDQFAAGYHWHFTWTYVLFDAFLQRCGYADDYESQKNDRFSFLFRPRFGLCSPFGSGTKGLTLVLFLVFLGWAALIPRPMARLVSSDRSDLLIDFHSHTSYSHDGRKSFTPAANRRWHERQGFGPLSLRTITELRETL